VKIKQVI